MIGFALQVTGTSCATEQLHGGVQGCHQCKAACHTLLLHTGGLQWSLATWDPLRECCTSAHPLCQSSRNPSESQDLALPFRGHSTAMHCWQATHKTGSHSRTANMQATPGRLQSWCATAPSCVQSMQIAKPMRQAHGADAADRTLPMLAST